MENINGTQGTNGKADKKMKNKKIKPTLEEVPENGTDSQSKFARALASTDYQTREKGLHALTQWMVHRREISEKEMLRIWKGLFYCFWHADKAPVQAQLADRLAAILTQLHDASAYLYFTTFINTMRREWFGIDRLRLDKFLMLVRQFILQLCMLLKQRAWALDACQQYATFLRDTVLLPQQQAANKALGVAYHLSDVWLPELMKAAAELPPSAESLQALLAPFGAAVQKAGEQATIDRIREGFYDVLVQEVASPSEQQPLRHLATGQLAAQLFDLGAQEGVKARNREALYAVSNELERAAKKRARRQEQQQQQQEEDAAAGKKAAAAAAAAVQEQQRVAAASGEVQQSGKKKGKKRSLQEDAAAVSAAPAVAPAAAAEEPVANGHVAATPASAKKKNKKAAAAAAAEAAAAEEHAAATPASAKKKKNKKAAAATAAAEAAAAEEQQQQEQQQQQAEPPSSKKKKKRAAEEPAAASAAAPSPAAAPAAAAPTAAPSSSKKAKKAKQQLQQQQATDNTPAAADPSPAATAAAAAAAAAKKRVQFNIKANLYHDFGGPKPDPDVRTPSKAKGPALKKTSTVGSRRKASSAPPKVGGSRLQKASPAAAGPAWADMGRLGGGKGSASAGPKAGGGKQGRATPKSAPRAKALDFF